ncbi:MAG: single-stranded DNA-binding protein [Marinilabiliales bacterium]|nr:MAG: single-stranded DNA-binding protein [Marinilabiliales bacterium]
MKKNETKSESANKAEAKKSVNSEKDPLNLNGKDNTKKNPERNYVELCGYAASSPEIRVFENGNKVASFRIATHEDIKNDAGEWTRITMWHPVVTWNRLADHAMQYVNKGSLVNLKGKIRRRSYTDKEGLTRVRFELVANDLAANIA